MTRQYSQFLLCALLVIGCGKAPRPVVQSEEVARLQTHQEPDNEAEPDDQDTGVVREPPVQVPAQSAPPVPGTHRISKEQRAIISHLHYASVKLQNDGLREASDALANYAGGPLYDKAIKLLRDVSEFTLMKRRNHWRVVQARAWPNLAKLVDPVLAKYRPKHKRSISMVLEILMAAMNYVNRDGSYDRAAGYALTNHVFKALSKRMPTGFEVPYLKSIAARLALARKTNERRLLVETVGHHDRKGVLLAFMASTILDDREWVVRSTGLKELRGCTTKYNACKISRRIIDQIYETHPDARTRSELVLYASQINYDKVTKWCTGQLSRGPMIHACRSGLSTVGSRAAFETLYRWIKIRMHDAETQLVGNYTFRDEFKALLPYADRRFAKEKYYGLLYEVLGQSVRSGYATGGIIRTMSQLRDAKRARSLLHATRAFYKAKLGAGPHHRSHEFLFDEMEKMEVILTKLATKQIKEEKSSTLQIKKRPSIPKKLKASDKP